MDYLSSQLHFCFHVRFLACGDAEEAVISATFRRGSYRSYICWIKKICFCRWYSYDNVYSMLLYGASMIGSKLETDSITTMPPYVCCAVMCVLLGIYMVCFILQLLVWKHLVSLSTQQFFSGNVRCRPRPTKCGLWHQKSRKI